MKRLALLGLVLLSVGLAACGSSSSSSSSASSSASAPSSTPASTGSGTTSSAGAGSYTPAAGDDAALFGITGQHTLTGPTTTAVLGPRVAGYEKTPQKLLINTPVSKKATPGKTMALLVCGVPVCANFGNAAAQAATLLGWKVTRIALGVAPADFIAAYNRAIQIKPDIVVGSGLPRSLFAQQLDTLQKMNIPVIQWSSPQTPVPGHLWTPTSQPIYQASGQMLAEDIANDSNLNAKVVSYTVPQYGLIELQAQTLKHYLPGICPKCSVDQVELSVTDIGQAGPKVTAYLQQHPDVKYVVMGFSDLATGVASAIKAAGITGVKILSKDTDTPTIQNLVSGTEYASIPLPIGQTGWQIVDLAQRIFNGDSTKDTSLLPEQIVTKAAITDPKSDLIGAVPDYQAQYKKLWLLNK